MNATMERSAAQGSQQYQVADLLIDVGRQRVTRADVEISLPKLSFDLLLTMIRAAPNFVSIDTLMTQVWPGIVVSPETVSQRVKLLRDALGDDAHEPRYIAGLRGRGYRLMAAARPLGELPNSAAAHAAAPAITPKRFRLRVVLSMLTGLAALGLAGFLLITLRPQPAPISPPDTVTVVGLPPRTVAVLPFENLSPDTANDYLALGMAEMVLNRLAQVREIVVIARASSFRFRDSAADARTIGGELGARYLIEGSVQRDAQQLRVTARLIDAQSGSQIKSLHFDRTLGDIFSIQDEIANAMANALEANLASAGAPGVHGARSDNLDAYLAYLQGRALLEKYTGAASDEAAEHFRRAIALDPRFAAAYAALADAQLEAAYRRFPGRDYSHLDVGKSAPLIEKALALDSSLGTAYLWRANASDWTHQAGQAEADFLKGIELDPSNGRGLTMFAEFLLGAGRSEEALRTLDRALLVDPLSARALYVKAVYASPPEHRGIAGVEQDLLGVLKIDPDFHPALTRLGRYRWFVHGEFAQAVKLLERAIALDPENPWPRQSAYLAYLDLGDLAAARDVSEPTPGSAGVARFQMLQYLGDWRAAGESAYDSPAWLRGEGQNAREAEAIRDHTLGTHAYERAIQFMDAAYNRGDRGLWGQVAFAHVLRSSGQKARSDRMLDDLLIALDREQSIGAPRVHRTRADAFALQGRRDAALAELERAFRSGDRSMWWYTIDRDPLYKEMRSAARFQAIAAEARAHAARQRVLLEEMRRKGEAPVRPSVAPQRASR